MDDLMFQAVVSEFVRPAVLTDELSKQECSELLDAMTNWEHAPAEMRRAMGQMDLFEVAS